MAAITWADVVAFDATLALIDATVGAMWAALSNEMVNVVNFGGEASVRLKMARILFAAHGATMASIVGTGGGPVTSEQLGDESRTYASAMSASGSGLTATGFGLALKSLIHASPARAGWVVGMPYS